MRFINDNHHRFSPLFFAVEDFPLNLLIHRRLGCAGRKREDSQTPIKEAIAKRESAETAIDVAVRDFRLKLSARGLNATSEPPYTHIFHDGVTYYISNRLKLVKPRCAELLARVESEFPENDTLRVEITQAITTALERFETAVDEVNAARTTAAIARTHYKSTRKEWNARMTRVYAALLADLGKQEANRFFPKHRKPQHEPDSIADTPTPVEEASPSRQTATAITQLAS